MEDDRFSADIIQPVEADALEVAELATKPDHVDEFVSRALEALQDVVPFELAAYLEHFGAALVTRRARGPLATAAVRRYRTPVSEHPAIMRFLEKRRPLLFQVEDPEQEAPLFGDVVDLPEDHSCLLIPVVVGDRVAGLVALVSRKSSVYSDEAIHVAIVYGQLIGLGIAAARQNEQLERFHATLREQNRLLSEEIGADSDAVRMLEDAKSRVMRRLTQMARQVAITDAPVLITGETGTGKEVLARAIHAWSRRGSRPFVQVNCAALPKDLIESELFGHRKGAFSGAVEARPGRFRVADGGTILLDEIGELPVETQSKLLRVLQEKTFEPVGSDETVETDARVVAATNVDLEAAIEEGEFREDLYYRLNVFPIHLPPLRERVEDIPAIARNILERIARRTGRGPWTIGDADIGRLQDYDWPGNVRELVNAIERARVFAPLGGALKVGDAIRGGRRKPRAGGADQSWPTLHEHEKAYIERALGRTKGKIYGKDGAAKLLGVPPTTLQSKIARLDVERPGD